MFRDAGRAAYKRPRPALSEINKHIISEWCSSPLALPLSGPTRSSIEINGFLGRTHACLQVFDLQEGHAGYARSACRPLVRPFRRATGPSRNPVKTGSWWASAGAGIGAGVG